MHSCRNSRQPPPLWVGFLYHSQLVSLQQLTIMFLSKKAQLLILSALWIVNFNFLCMLVIFLSKLSGSPLTVQIILSIYLSDYCLSISGSLSVLLISGNWSNTTSCLSFSLKVGHHHSAISWFFAFHVFSSIRDTKVSFKAASTWFYGA